jgi:prefoldin subunit 5
VQPVKDDPQKWEVVFTLPFEYNAAIAHIANGISALKRSIENRISALAGDCKTRFEKIEAALEDLDKRLTRLKEKHKHILKEEEDYEEEDW